jgi:endonuclease G
MSLKIRLSSQTLGTLGVAWMVGVSTLGSAATFPVVGDVSVEENRHAGLGFPSQIDDADVLVSRKQYLINWNSDLRAPSWVAWLLNKRYLGDVARSSGFRVDHELSSYLNEVGRASVGPDEYRGSCMDRGHQVASGDRTATYGDNVATFVMSNVSPQSAFLNRRTWLSFERFLRNLVLEQGKEVFIYAGSGGRVLGKMGINRDIQVRAKNYKIAVIKPAGYDHNPKNMRVIAVEFPNVTSTGSNPVSDVKQACYDSEHTMRVVDTNRQPYWRQFSTDVEAIEASSGLDYSFLYDIPTISDEELEELIQGQILNSKSFTSLPQKVGSMVTSLYHDLMD